MCKDLSRGMKVNEFADLTTSEFVSEYPEENPNIAWSGLFFCACRLESELNCRQSCVVIFHSQSSAHLSHLHWIKTQGPGL